MLIVNYRKGKSTIIMIIFMLATISANTILVERFHDEFTKGGHFVDMYKMKKSFFNGEILSSLVGAWDRLASRHKIEYWLYAGSALGVFCHNGPLPGDDDVDVGIRASDFTRLAVLTSLEHRKNSRYQLIIRAGLHSDIIAAKFVDTFTGRFIDVILFFNNNPLHPTRLVHYWSNGICSGCKQNPVRLELPINLVFPTRQCIFGNSSSRCPNNLGEVCYKMYQSPFYNCKNSRFQK